MAGRYEELAEQYRTELAFIDDERRASLLLEMRMALENQAAQDLAEFHAFKVCGVCHRIYSREEWNRLSPSGAGLHREDDYSKEERRKCATHECGTMLVAVVQIYGGMPLKDARRTKMCAQESCLCSGCRKQIATGEPCVAYTPRAAGLGAVAQQILCTSCEFTGTFK